MGKFSQAKQITWIGFTDISSSIISAIFWFYIASSIDPEKYGNISYLLGVSGLVQIFASIIPAQVVTVDTSKEIRLQTTYFIILMISSVVSSIVMSIWFSRLDVGILIFGLSIAGFSMAIMIGKKHYKKYAKYILLQKVLLVIFGFGLFHLAGFNALIYGVGLSFFIFIPFLLKEIKYDKFDLSNLKLRSKFIVDTYILMVVSGLRREIDKLIIPLILGFAVLGNYSLSIQSVMMLMVIPSSIFKYTLPRDSVGQNTEKIQKYLLVFAVIASVLSIFLLPGVISKAFPKYSDAISMIQIMSLSVIPLSLSSNYSSKLLGQSISRPIIISNVIHLSTLISCIFLLGVTYGTIGLASSHVIAAVAQCIYLHITKNYKFKRI